MGCGASTSKPVQPVDEPDTDKILMTESEQNKFNMRVLMLGTGESGKTTVVKQFQRIVNSADTGFQKADYKLQLRRNVVMAIQTLIQATEELNIIIEDDRLRKFSIEIMLLDVSNVNTLLKPDLAQNIYDLWQCPVIQELYTKRRTEFWSTDATPYYLDEVVRIASENFEPNEDDFLMTRIRSTGVVVTEMIEKPYKFQFVDVGGQRSERRKWIHCFDDVSVIIYMVSLPGYCQGMSCVIFVLLSVRVFYTSSGSQHTHLFPSIVFLICCSDVRGQPREHHERVAVGLRGHCEEPDLQEHAHLRLPQQKRHLPGARVRVEV